MCLEALSRQIDGPSMEVIVPYHQDVEGIDGLRRRFPQVSYVAVDDPRVSARRVGSREHHDILRARGLAAARGEIVALLEDHEWPNQHWAASVVAAHRDDFAAIGGAIENGVDRPLNWAVYYCDFSRYQNPVPSGESPFASDANVTYKRAVLEGIRSVWEPSFREVVVHAALVSQGRKVALRREIVVYQNRRRLQFAAAVSERFVWGRSFAMTRGMLLGTRRRIVYAALSPLLPAILLSRMARNAWGRGHFGRFLTAIPIIVLLVTVWSIGEGAGYLTAPARDNSG